MVINFCADALIEKQLLQIQIQYLMNFTLNHLQQQYPSAKQPMDREQEQSPLAALFDHAQYIKAIEKLENFKCIICYQIPLEPVRCKNCRQAYCLSCASRQKKLNNQCAYRCEKFEIEEYPDFESSLRCPYNLECSAELRTVSEFDDHSMSCKYGTDRQREGVINRRLYKCTSGKHPLEFKVGTYDQMLTGMQCSLCKEKTLIRSACRKCKELFCVRCRPVPTTKSSCPLGHKLVCSKIAHVNYVCDICNTSSCLSGNEIYDDSRCNFGVCLRCYNNLPQKLDNRVEWVINEPEFCQTKFKDSEEKAEHTVVPYKSEEPCQCEMCLAKILSGQRCKVCSKTYCLLCKPFLVEDIHLCKFGHTIAIKKYSKSMQEEIGIKCDRCQGQILEDYASDQGCGVCLCPECLTYGIKILSQRERMSQPVLCLEQHPLMLHCYSKDYFGICSQCKKSKCIKFFCNLCKDKGLFCCKCRIVDNPHKCYFGHLMTALNEQQLQTQLSNSTLSTLGMVCHFCSRVEKFTKMYRCKKCCLNCCQECMTSIENKQQISDVEIKPEIVQALKYAGLWLSN